jgi:hypothetical protein
VPDCTHVARVAQPSGECRALRRVAVASLASGMVIQSIEQRRAGCIRQSTIPPSPQYQ